jgi:hypothetical protein
MSSDTDGTVGLYKLFSVEDGKPTRVSHNLSLVPMQQLLIAPLYATMGTDTTHS